MIYVILGMHKSGTTLLAQILQASGINMGEHNEHLSYDQGNKYERASTRQLNGKILGCEGLTSIDIRPPTTLTRTPAQQIVMQQIIRDCEEKYPQGWGFKDPRTCFTYPLWASSLTVHKLIAIYRTPKELWQRYRPDHLWNRYRDLHVAARLMRSWCDHNQRILQILQSTSMEYLLLDYQSLMTTQTEFQRLQQFVGQSLQDQRRIGLYRHRPDKTSWMLNLASWLVHRQTGQHADTIMQQLSLLRKEQYNSVSTPQ